MKYWVFFLLVPLALFSAEKKIEIRGVYLYFLEHSLQKIYHNGGLEAEIEASREIGKKVNQLDLWGNFNYFRKKGKSIGLHEPTRINLFNISSGIKTNFSLRKEGLFFQLGIGPVLGIVDVHNSSSFVKKNYQKVVFGGVVKTGFTYMLKHRWYLDIFSDYYYQPISGISNDSRNITGKSTNVGGFRWGIGWGYRW